MILGNMKHIWLDEYQILETTKIDRERLNELLNSPILRRTKNFVEIMDSNNLS